MFEPRAFGSWGLDPDVSAGFPPAFVPLAPPTIEKRASRCSQLKHDGAAHLRTSCIAVARSCTVNGSAFRVSRGTPISLGARDPIMPDFWKFLLIFRPSSAVTENCNLAA